MKVLKFGGTSVGTVESLRHVKAIVESQQSRCIVIVSALGGITDRLIRTANLAASRDHAYTTEFEIVTARHHEVIEGVVPAESRAEVLAITDAMLDELATLYKAICLLGELTPRTLDMIVSYGERMSCVIASRILGVPVLDSRSFIRTQSRFGKHVLDAETTSSLLHAAFGPLEQANTVVVPGFIASDSNAQVTNLGRGGSDYTAAIIAAELGAEILEIWTDVDGFMTADPRIVADARVIDRLSFVEAMELCNFGAKVVYPPTIYPVFHRNIPIVIKNTFNASAPGTMIAERVNQTEMTVKGVTSLADTALIRVVGRTFHDFGRVVNSMARNGVDMFLASPTAGTFGVRQNDSVKAVSVLREELAAELTSGDVDAIEAVDSLATLAIVGRNLRSMPESAEMLRRALNQEGIPVLTAPRNDSDTTVACMVPASHVKQALNAVHSSFFS
jgi:aspartokinase/homoserine dehydrogenase 1